MENRFITNPAVADAATLYSDFGCGKNDIIALSVEDFTETLKDANIAVAIEKSASGPERLKLAISDIKASFGEIAPGLDLSRADKVLCLIVTPEDFKIKEMDHLSEFFKDFSDDTNIIWGVTRKQPDTSDDVTIRLLVVYP